MSYTPTAEQLREKLKEAVEHIRNLVHPNIHPKYKSDAKGWLNDYDKEKDNNKLVPGPKGGCPDWHEETCTCGKDEFKNWP